MKKLVTKILLCLLLSVSVIGSVNAWWVQPALVVATPTMITAFIVNNQNKNIYCQGTVYGKTIYGTVLYQWGAGTILPGDGVKIQVFTIPEVPFESGWAEVQCR